MKRTVPLILIAVILAASACSSFPRLEMSPEQRWDMAASLYTRTLKALTLLRQAGHIDDEGHAQLVVLRKAARAAINEMEIAITSGGGNFNTAWRVFSAVIDEMIGAQLRAEARADSKPDRLEVEIDINVGPGRARDTAEVDSGGDA